MTGRLIGVVGPSGVGKDTVMRALADAVPEITLVRRVITRAPELGGEDFDSVDPATFQQMAADGAFCIQWHAHGLSYGIPETVRTRVAAGEVLAVNLSRRVLDQAAALFPGFVALNITASPATLRARLLARGRETDDEISRRLARTVEVTAHAAPVIAIANDGPIEDTVARIIDELGLASAEPNAHSEARARPLGLET